MIPSIVSYPTEFIKYPENAKEMTAKNGNRQKQNVSVYAKTGDHYRAELKPLDEASWTGASFAFSPAHRDRAI